MKPVTVCSVKMCRKKGVRFGSRRRWALCAKHGDRMDQGLRMQCNGFQLWRGILLIGSRVFESGGHL